MGLDPGFRTGVKVAVVDATGKVVATDGDLSARAAAAVGRSARDARPSSPQHQRRADRDRQRHRVARDRQARDRAGQAAARARRLTKIVVSEAGASVYSASAFASQELPDLDVTLRGAVSIARRLQDPLAELVKIDPEVDRRRPVPARRQPRPSSRARSMPWSRIASTRSASTSTPPRRRCWRASPASARGSRRTSSLHRDANGPFRVPQGAQEGAAARPEGVRAMRRLPAHPRRRRSARRLRRASGGLSGGAADHRGGQDRHQGADRQRRRCCARWRRRSFVDDDVRPADRDRHPARAGEARPRSAPGVQGRRLQGGRRDDRRPQARHGARRRGDQRRGVRRLRRHRRAPGRAGARLGDVARPSSRTRARW